MRSELLFLYRVSIACNSNRFRLYSVSPPEPLHDPVQPAHLMQLSAAKSCMRCLAGLGSLYRWSAVSSACLLRCVLTLLVLSARQGGGSWATQDRPSRPYIYEESRLVDISYRLHCCAFVSSSSFRSLPNRASLHDTSSSSTKPDPFPLSGTAVKAESLETEAQLEYKHSPVCWAVLGNDREGVRSPPWRPRKTAVLSRTGHVVAILQRSSMPTLRRYGLSFEMSSCAAFTAWRGHWNAKKRPIRERTMASCLNAKTNDFNVISQRFEIQRPIEGAASLKLI